MAMGLFRRGRDTTEIDHLREQIQLLSNRVNETSDSQSELSDQVQQAAAGAEQIDKIQRSVAELDAIKRRVAGLDAIERRVAGLDAIERRVAGLDAIERRVAELDAIEQRIVALDELAAEPSDSTPNHIPRPPEAPLPTPSPELAVAEKAELDELRDRLEQLEQRIDTVDQRLTATTTELANQIAEISGELEGLGPDADPATASVAEETLEALRSGQERLASEQARYQITFRQDLAELADRLRNQPH